MRRTWVLAAAAAAVLGSAALWHYYPTPKAEAGEQQKSKGDADKQVTDAPRELLNVKKDETQQPTVGTQQLPIGQVVLFSSGVGYFQREGTVEGTTRVDLSFPVTDINDLLKSMVLRDLDGGHTSTVSYDSSAPVERTLKSFAINLTGNPSFGAILNQARGEKVEVVLQQANATQPGTLTGTVVGIEKQHVAVGKDTVEVEMLNLWCADGVRSLKMNELQRVRFLNPVMDSEFRKA